MPPSRPPVNTRNPPLSVAHGLDANPRIWRLPLTFCVIAGLISAGESRMRPECPHLGFQTETHEKRPAMSQLDLAINRLDAAMARLDAAVAESAARGERDRELLQSELAILRQTYDLLQTEARIVADQLDDVIDRLGDVAQVEAVGQR